MGFLNNFPANICIGPMTGHYTILHLPLKIFYNVYNASYDLDN